MPKYILHRFCAAPMLGATDRHFRSFVRFLSQKTFVYSELVHCHAITKGNYRIELAENAAAHPAALQLAGCDPQSLGEASYAAYQNGFDEINLNIGCPSPKGVVSNFGLCLMDDPELTAECVRACVQGSPLPVTVKCRLGSNPEYSKDKLLKFLELNMAAGCRCFIVHARKADMQSFDTAQNRTKPPLDYEAVYRLKQRYPETEWILNGDIKTAKQAQEHLQYVDGVMLGRALYHNIFLLASVDSRFFDLPDLIHSRREFLIQKAIPYIQARLDKGKPLSHFVRHLLSLYQYQPHANAWRRFLAENAYKPGASLDVLYKALEIAEGV
ncbi:tRNA dihydrouridine(20/20a) synthase DusA [bacterium]|nr:tRNA dihydrouridine(20/20a) synthase DusA [bacterium]